MTCVASGWLNAGPPACDGSISQPLKSPGAHCRRHCIFAVPNSLSWRMRGAVRRLAPAVEGRHP